MLTFKRKHLPSLHTINNNYSSFGNIAARHRFEKMNRVYTWLVMPVLGVVLPTATGLLQPNFAYDWLLIHYLFFIAIALIIYKGNMFFLHSIRLHYRGSSLPYHHIVGIYFMVNILYSGVVSLASLSTWNGIVTGGAPFDKPVITTTLIILICVLFINNLYEIFYLQAAKKESDEKMVLLENAKLQAELQALNSQIDPHFMYNALTSLSYLLQQNPSQADNYNAMLAAQYRYVLKNKCCHFVTLEQEIEFCQQYFAIQQIRFGHSALLQVVRGNCNLEKMKIPPLSVQTLIENALKHNNFSEEKPLTIQIVVNPDYISIINKIHPLLYPTKSCGTGIENLNKRLQLLTKQSLQITQINGEFLVRIPLMAA